MTAAPNGPTAPWKLTVYAAAAAAAARAGDARGARATERMPPDPVVPPGICEARQVAALHAGRLKAGLRHAGELREQPIRPRRQRRLRRPQARPRRRPPGVAGVKDLDVRGQRGRAAGRVLGYREHRRSRRSARPEAARTDWGAAHRRTDRRTRWRRRAWRRWWRWRARTGWPSWPWSTCRHRFRFAWGAPFSCGPRSGIDDANSLVVGVGDVQSRRGVGISTPAGQSSSAAVAGPLSPANPGSPQRPANVAMMPSGGHDAHAVIVLVGDVEAAVGGGLRRRSAGRAARRRQARRPRRSPTSPSRRRW